MPGQQMQRVIPEYRGIPVIMDTIQCHAAMLTADLQDLMFEAQLFNEGPITDREKFLKKSKVMFKEIENMVDGLQYLKLTIQELTPNIPDTE